MLDILCIGDAKIDILLQIPDDDPHFSLDETKENLKISYGRKISVENYIKTLGGNACNAAVGLSRLGINAGLCAEIGNDEFSNYIINSLDKERINTNFVIRDAAKQTSFSVCINYERERTLLSEHVKRDHNFDFENTSASFIYLTSLGAIWQSAYQKVLDFIKNKKIPFAFNPGTVQIQNREEIIIDLIGSCDYLFVNKQEAQDLLFGKDTNLTTEQNEIKKLLFGLKSLGAKNVVITDSKNGSFAYDGKNIYHLGIIETDVVDKTGAGDAYSSGFLSAIIQKKSMENAMIWGTINATSVISSVGAQNGLLKTGNLSEKTNSLGNFKAEII